MNNDFFFIFTQTGIESCFDEIYICTSHDKFLNLYFENNLKLFFILLNFNSQRDIIVLAIMILFLYTIKVWTIINQIFPIVQKIHKNNFV